MVFFGQWLLYFFEGRQFAIVESKVSGWGGRGVRREQSVQQRIPGSDGAVSEICHYCEICHCVIVIIVKFVMYCEICHVL